MGERYLGVLYILETVSLKLYQTSNLKIWLEKWLSIEVFNKKCCICRCLELKGALRSTQTFIILQMRH